MKQTVSRVIKSENYNVQLPVVLLEVTNSTGCLELFVKNKLNFMFHFFQHVTMVLRKTETTSYKSKVEQYLVTHRKIYPLYRNYKIVVSLQKI